MLFNKCLAHRAAERLHGDLGWVYMAISVLLPAYWTMPPSALSEINGFQATSAPLLSLQPQGFEQRDDFVDLILRKPWIWHGLIGP
jgi:hypothetical protein